MKLAAVYFDDTVCIPGGKDVGGGARRQDLRESTFHVDDGWELSLHDEPGGARFCIWREGMSRSAWVGGYGYTFLAAPPLTGTATVTSIDGSGGGTVTLTNAEDARVFVPSTPEQDEALLGVKPKRRRK